MGDVYTPKTETNCFKMGADRSLASPIYQLLAGSLHMGPVQTRREGLRTPKLVAEELRSHIACDVRARTLPPAQGPGGPCARERGAGRFLDSPADLTEPLAAADVVANTSAEDSQLFNCLINSS